MHHGLARYALREQDHWGDAEHRRFWLDLLPLWPKALGRPQHLHTLVWWWGELRRRGVAEDKIAEVLGYPGSPDTLRRLRVAERFEELHHERIECPRLRVAAPPLPRVYVASEEPPLFTRVNLPATALANVRPARALAIEHRASELLHEKR